MGPARAARLFGGPRQPQPVRVRAAEARLDAGKRDRRSHRDCLEAGAALPDHEHRLGSAGASVARGVRAARGLSRSVLDDGRRHARPVHCLFQCGQPAPGARRRTPP